MFSISKNDLIPFIITNYIYKVVSLVLMVCPMACFYHRHKFVKEPTNLMDVFIMCIIPVPIVISNLPLGILKNPIYFE